MSRAPEGKDRIGSGTSYAAPQVAGAAALYRSLKSTATALETRAALLASTEDISGANTGVFSTVNAYGQGYLRDDELVKIAQGGSTVTVQNANLTPGTTSRGYQVQVTAGKSYVAALAWYRYDVRLPEGWSNLFLVARQGANVLASSDSWMNTYERIEFKASQSGTVTLTVGANSLEAGLSASGLPFSLVFHESLPFAAKNVSMVYPIGTQCMGSVVFQGRTEGPRLIIGMDPLIGTTHSFYLDPTLPAVPVMFVIGVSDALWGSQPLPIDLTPAGAAGCSIYVSLDVLIPRHAGSAGAHGGAVLQLEVPQNPSLLGLQYYLQAAASDPAANRMGMTTSNGLGIRIGNPR